MTNIKHAKNDKNGGEEARAEAGEKEEGKIIVSLRMQNILLNSCVDNKQRGKNLI